MNPPLNPDIPAQREELRRLFEMKRTECKMMAERGYDLEFSFLMKSDRSFVRVDLRPLLNPTLGMTDQLQVYQTGKDTPYFTTMLDYRKQSGVFQSRQEFTTIYYTPDKTKQILVLYLTNEPGKDVVKKDFAIVDEFVATGQFHDLILVVKTKLGAENSNKVQTRMTGYRIQVFNDSELAFPRVKHAYSPIEIHHIPSSEVKTWSQNEKLQPEKLPMILNIDAVSKWYGAKPLDVLQTELLGTTTDTIGYYRIVRQTSAKQ